MKKNKNQQLMEQREQSQVCLSSAESRQKKAKGQYVQANRDWLVAKSQEDGVKALPKGIYYKVLAEGDATSATPTPSSVITAHYTGKTIDGATFDSSRGDVPLACRLRDLIEGWVIAMQQMHIGDRWEVYIPAEMGYGKYWLCLPLSRLGKARTSSAFLSLFHRFPTRHPRRLHPHLRHRTARHQLMAKGKITATEQVVLQEKDNHG